MPPSVHKIAIIEDDRDLQFIYKLKFESVGFKVMAASDGEKGLEVIQAFQPDLILLDLRMPKMSGDELLTRLRASDWGREIRVIILTNISKSEAPPVLRFLNVDRYIVKAHYTPAQVVGVARDVLGIEVY
jgi:DNA-binding response OmpR family regulator